MSKTAISQYSATPSSNSDVDGIDISEGCPASNLNNAQRSLMSHLKEMDDGTSALTSPSMGQLNVDNLRLDGNTISSTDTNGNVTIDPDGTGDTIIASGNVGIGTASPASQLDLGGGATNSSRLRLNRGTDDANQFMTVGYDNISVHRANVALASAQTNMKFPQVGSDGTRTAMQIDSSGNVLGGKTSADNGATAGIEIRGDVDKIYVTDSASSPLICNRLSNDGNIAVFLKDGSTAGSIGASGGGSEIYFTGNVSGTAGLYMANSSRVVPMRSGSISDNTVDCGHPSYRFDDIYATNGTIQTSDQNEKQQIASLTTAEITAAKSISALFKTFKWNDKVEAKGDDARTHTGVIAQEVQSAMTDAGLDAADYAFWCSNTWTDDDGNSQTRMGIRYPELLAFVGAATEQRLADIETRLTALEAE